MAIEALALEGADQDRSAAAGRAFVLHGVGDRHEHRWGPDRGQGRAALARPAKIEGESAATGESRFRVDGRGEREAALACADDLKHALHLAHGVAPVPAREPLGVREIVALLPDPQRAGLDAGSVRELPDGQQFIHKLQQSV